MGEYLSSPIKDKNTEEGENSFLRYGAVGMQGWRKSMEDSHLAALDVVEGEISIFGVFDGHGGCEVAHFIANHFVDEIKKTESFKKGDYKNALIDTFLTIDKLLLTDQGKKELQRIAHKYSTGGPTMQGGDIPFNAGCTACVALITKTEIYVANAGDTRCVLGSKSKAKDLSHDHKPDLPAEKKRVERAGGFVEEGRVNGVIAISRAVGDWEYKSASLKPEENMVTAYPEVIVETIKPEHDFLIIACDGIWDCQTSQQAVEFVYSQMKRMQKAEASSPTLKNASTSGSSSGSKKTSLAQQNSPKKSMKVGKSPELAKPLKGLPLILGNLMDKICPSNLATSEGLGADNMTGIIIEFVKKE